MRLVPNRVKFPAAVPVALIAIAALWFACDSRPDNPGPTNPLDPDNPATGGDPFNLTTSLEGGRVTVAWLDVSISGLTGYNLYRKSDRDTSFTLVYEAGASEISWIDLSPPHFTMTKYRITAVGGDFSESDTTGRGLDSIDIPPLFQVGTGDPVVRSRFVELRIMAEGGDFMRIATDSAALDPAPWEPFDTLKAWTLDAGFDTTRFFAQVQREGEEPSDVVSAIAVPARTDPGIVLAGGDPTVAFTELGAELEGTAAKKIVLSEDIDFGGPGDSSITFEEPTDVESLIVIWRFEPDLETKRLFAQFSNDFGVDTFAVDSVFPDPLENVSVVMANGETIIDDCVIPARLSAVATLMNLTAGFPPEGWVPYDTLATVVLPDTTAGDFILEVQFSNDYVNTAPAPARDTVTFEPIDLAVVITEPAGPDTTVGAEEDTTITFATYEAGASVTVTGSMVAASCAPLPGEVDVWFGESQAGTANAADASWSLIAAIGESIVETTLVDVIARTEDERGNIAADTVRVRVVPPSGG